ncbi:MAG: hypothetical protein JW918_14785 [Anaerolineae bacterium]|nr:hypothetical protein [Anaerolineae bacterium]
MSKKENHRRELAALIDQFIAAGDSEDLIDYITSNSNLPGPRGNLELAEAFADLVGQCAREKSGRLWELCANMTAVSADEAPVNAPRELIPFCGAVGSGALGATCPTLFAKAIKTLRALANDPRWRMREAVPMALQRLIAAHSKKTLNTLKHWTAEGSPLEVRAAAAGVAEPALLRNDESAQAGLELHETIFDRMPEFDDRKSDEFKALKKGLGYTLSVVVQASPREGFALMRQLVGTQDKDVLWIVRENLKKNRLVKNFPAQVESIKSSLEAAK